MTDRSYQLGNENIRSLLIKYSTPAMFAMLVNATYNVVDRIFVGNAAGTNALAAFTVAFPIQMIVIATGMAIGVGTASVVSRSLGAQDRDRADRAAGTSFAVAGLLNLGFAVLGLTFLVPLLRLFGATDEVLPHAKDYMSVIFLGSFFLGIAVSSNNIARAEGNARVAMITMLVGAIVNVILDPIFIFGLDMGMRGAAVATVIANVCSFVFLCGYFMSGKSMLRITLRHLVPDFSLLPEVFKIGAASFFSMVAGSIMAIPINSLVVHYGEPVHLAILGVGNTAMMFFFMPIFGLTQGLQPIIGFNYGARNIVRVNEAVRVASLYSTVLSFGAFLVLMLATKPVLSIFSNDPDLISKGAPIIRVIIIFMPFVGFQMVGGTLFQSLGKALPAFVMTLSRQVIILLPLIFILPRLYGLPGLWCAFPIADAAATAMTALWVMAEIRRLNRSISAAGSANAPIVDESAGA